MNTREDIIIHLEKERTRNISMINFIRTYPLLSADREGNSVLIRGRSDEDWVYISSTNPDEFHRLISRLDRQDKCFAVIEDWMLPQIVGTRHVTSRLSCVKLVYEGNFDLSESRYTVVDLKPEDALYIYKNSKYQEFTSVEYIIDRIEKGTGMGIFDGDRLAAWLITHDDGAMGFLHVLDDYRGRGYAKAVTTAVICRLGKLGQLPFVQIEMDNVKSMNLARKLGFVEYGPVHWVKLE